MDGENEPIAEAEAPIEQEDIEQPQDLDAVLMMLCANESHFINGAIIQADDGHAL